MDNPSIKSRLMHAWNMFKDPTAYRDLLMPGNIGGFSTSIPQRRRVFGSEKSVVSGVTNKIALDVSGFDIRHVRTTPEGQYMITLKTALHDCLTVEANKDQTGKAFLQDVVLSMFDEGVVAIVPIEADFDPISNNGRFEIYSLRAGRIVEWYPDHVRVDLYNDIKGIREQIVLPKRMVAIVQNPLYEIMNEPNSTLKRLVSKLNLLDTLDNQQSSGKLDLIIQLPYVVKNAARQKQAEARRMAIEEQLSNSKYGIAYTDGTEKITQLNRPVENTLQSQVEYLTKQFHSQLGVTEAVFLGTADEAAMLNYYDRTVEPIITAIIDEMSRKFLSKTARTQGQTLMGFRNIFRLMPANEIAELADSLSRNEIIAPNELRAVIGFRPHNDPKSDELRNRNMPNYDAQMSQNYDKEQPQVSDEYDKILEETLAGIEEDMIGIMGSFADEQQ